MSSKKKLFAQFGMVSKGMVYALIGVLTTMAALGYGNQSSGSKGALQFLAEQSYGKIMLTVMGIGLLGYVFWRFYQAMGNQNKSSENDAKKYAKRIAYFISGVIYGLLSYYAFHLVFGNSKNNAMGNSGNTTQTIVILIGVGMAIKAVYDIYRAYSENFREDIEEMDMSRSEQKLVLNAGKFGHTARGIVIGLMAYLTLKSGLSASGEINKKTDAFSFISNEFGTWALGLIAVGLIAYAIFMFIKAKYPSIGIR